MPWDKLGCAVKSKQKFDETRDQNLNGLKDQRFTSNAFEDHCVSGQLSKLTILYIMTQFAALYQHVLSQLLRQEKT